MGDSDDAVRPHSVAGASRRCTALPRPGTTDGRTAGRALQRARRDLRQVRRTPRQRLGRAQHGPAGRRHRLPEGPLCPGHQRVGRSPAAEQDPLPAGLIHRSTTPITSISTSRPGTASALTATRVEVTTDPLSAVRSALVTAAMSRMSVTKIVMRVRSARRDPDAFSADSILRMLTLVCWAASLPWTLPLASSEVVPETNTNGPLRIART